MSDERAERWRRLETLLAAALERTPAERDSFLADACGDDPALRAEVGSLLAAHERTGALDRLGQAVQPLAAGLRPERAGVFGGRRTTPTFEGRQLGPYQVLEQVGGGGMGVVHRAHDQRLDRPVAIKFLHPHLDADPRAAERFRREARAAGALEHASICTVHEIGETPEGLLYLVMPLYDGETLQQRIARGPLPVEHAVAIAVQVLRGLAKAHARGIVHRDIKPSNVFLTTDGGVKLLDFGIAKLADVTLTGTADAPGTIAYMSPEQAAGRGVDHRTDLWSLGVVLYEMLAGQRPWLHGVAGTSAEALARSAPPLLTTLRRDVPPELARVVAQAIAPDPGARYATAVEFEQALMALGLAADLSSGAGTAARMPARAASFPWLRARTAAVPLAAIALVALLVVVLGRGTVASDAPPAIAVLPFVNLGDDSARRHLGDGLAEELIARLGQVEGLRVVSRTSAFAFRDRQTDIRAIGRRLGVTSVLEGSVRQADGRVRISVQLVDVDDGYQRWSESYDRNAQDIFLIQDEIAQSVVSALRRSIGSAPRVATQVNDRRSTSLEAYDYYLRGRYAWHQRTEASLLAAAAAFDSALALDPRFALAHAGSADAYAVLGFYSYLAPQDAFQRAKRAALRAVELDPALAEPHASLGYVALYHDWDWEEAEAAFRRAIARNPGYSVAHQWYGNLLTARGRFREAEREMRLAQEIDPLSRIASAALCWTYYHARRPEAALAQCDQTLALDPRFELAHLWRGWTLMSMNRHEEAIRPLRRAMELSNGSPITRAALARALALSGSREAAELALAELEAERTRYVPPYDLAKVHLALGRPDSALALLNLALEQRAHAMAFLEVDPQLDALRGDPRFAELTRRVVPRGR